MLNNLKLFEECIDKKASYIDPLSKEVLGKKIIPDSKGNISDLLIQNAKLVELLTEYSNLNNEGDTSKNSKIIFEIKECMKTKGMNLSTFSQYLMVHNLTYNIYVNDLNEEEQQYIIESYIKDRHQMYLIHEYSDITFQVLTDNYSHKRKGTFGTKKIKKILKDKGINHYKESSNKDKFFILPDNGDYKLFKEILKNENIKFKFALTKQGKKPDALVKINDKIIIIEHKNIKSTGGGQDKQIVEIIDFIKEGERGIYYVSYLDGLLFNSFKNPLETNKVYLIVNDIKKNLKENPYNYFVNTYGFEKLIDNLLK